MFLYIYNTIPLLSFPPSPMLKLGSTLLLVAQTLRQQYLYPSFKIMQINSAKAQSWNVKFSEWELIKKALNLTLLLIL